MKKCKYAKNECVLSAKLKVHLPLGNWCREQCWPNHQPAQLAMLRKFADIPEPPEGKDLLEWITEKVKDGTIKQKDKCCGKFKNIIKGFGRLIADEILGKDPEDWVVKRAEACAACEHRTFLNVIEWGTSAIFDDELPINHTPKRFDKLWCAKCKCCIEAKIRVEDEKCPDGKWPALA